MNVGLIIGYVNDWDAHETYQVPYVGAIVTLSYITRDSGKNKLTIRDPYKKGNFRIDPQYTDNNGEFSIPFVWWADEVGDAMASSRFQVVAISPMGRKAASGIAHGLLEFGADWTRLVKMIPGGMVSAGAGKLVNTAFSKHFHGLGGLAGLLGEPAPSKHASTKNLRALGSCEINL